MDLIVGISGATGTVYAVRFLEILKEMKDVTTHVIISKWAKANLQVETDYTIKYLESLADELYNNNNLGAKISSGSFITDGMIILPCSMKTLSAISNGYSDSLISRAADVVLKEGRKLVACPRETPLNTIHLENMTKLSKMGARIVPPMPSFYNNPKTLDDIINQHVVRILDQFGIHVRNGHRWNGMAKNRA